MPAERGTGDRWQRLLFWVSLVATGVLTTIILIPSLGSPITGDDRYVYPLQGGREDFTLTSEISSLDEVLEQRMAKGRVNALTAVERKVAARAVIDTAVATQRPIDVVQGALAVVLAALAMVAVYAFLRTLRWRSSSGGPVRLAGGTLGLVMVGGTLAFAVGNQPQVIGTTGLNGWVSYPVSTWTATISIFGVTALVLWLSRVIERGGVLARIASVLSLLLLGVVTNFRYELTFAAVPLAVIALLVVPITERERAGRGRLAKSVAGLAYVGAFIPVFVATRTALESRCAASGDCYSGVTMDLGVPVLRTFAYNMVTSVPGTGRDNLVDHLAEWGVPTEGLYTPTWWSLLTAAAVVLVLVIATWATRTRPAAAAAGRPDEERVAESRLCGVAALLLFLGSCGAAGIMSLSSGAQDIVSEIGIPYRHSVVTWTGLAFALMLLVAAVALRWRRGGYVAWGAVIVVVAVVAAVQMPANDRALEANHRDLAPTTAVLNQVVRGNTGEQGNQTRCRLVRQVRTELTQPSRRKVLVSADLAFERYWGSPFCRE